ncbi:hypothetical protein HDV01_005343 [Terramyces sp. JEL0728]|nr:hypothetical protein HDV01_005343 [Terramyces sp. JEL0728]
MNQNKLIETSFQVYFFFQVFKKYLEIPDFSPMDLEMAIFGKILATDYQIDKKKEGGMDAISNETKVAEAKEVVAEKEDIMQDWMDNKELQDGLLEHLIEALLPLISPQKKYNYQTWPYLLKKAIDQNLHDFYHHENPLKVTYSMKFDSIQRNEHPFYILSALDKLQILNYLCMWSLSEGSIKQAINDAAAKKDTGLLRGTPCGFDRNKNKIWHVGQTSRLYFQNKTKWAIVSSSIEELEVFGDHLWPIGPEEKREKERIEKQLEKERRERLEETKRLKLERLKKRREIDMNYKANTRKRSKQTNFKAYFASESDSEEDYVPRSRRVIETSDNKENESDNMDPLLA